MIDTTSVDQQFAQARQTGQQALEFSKAGPNLEQALRESVGQRLQQSPLYGQREKAAADVLTSAPRAREAVSGIVQKGLAGEEGGAILSPTQQQSIIASRQAADVVPLLSLNDLLQAQTGGVETAVGAGLSGYETMLNALQAQAALEQQQAQSAFDNLLALESARQKAAESKAGSEPSYLEKLIAGRMGLDTTGGAADSLNGGLPGSFVADEGAGGLSYLLPGGQPSAQELAGVGETPQAQPQSLYDALAGLASKFGRYIPIVGTQL